MFPVVEVLNTLVISCLHTRCDTLLPFFVYFFCLVPYFPFIVFFLSKFSLGFPFILFIMTHGQTLHELSLIVSFNAREYTCVHALYTDVKHFCSVLLEEDRNSVYDARYDVDCLSIAGGRTKIRKHRRSCGTALRHEEVAYVDMPFIGCTEKEAYANRLAQVVRRDFALGGNALITPSL